MRFKSFPILLIHLSLLGLTYSAPPSQGKEHARNLPQPVRGADYYPDGMPGDSKVELGLFLVRPLADADYYSDGMPDDARVELGQFLFFDKILSGNRNISCATCHHPMADTGDGLSLSIGEGGRGLGVMRDTGVLNGTPVTERVPRNAPHIFNLGAMEFERMFHDGRVQVNHLQSAGFDSPAGEDLPPGLENVLAAQAMFPVTSGTEMAGQAGENSIGDLAAVDDLPAIWEALAERLRAIPEYVSLFLSAYPSIADASQISYVDAANAIAAFEAVAWRADDSPFDRYLRGDVSALTAAQKRGVRLFYGKAGCASCHSGKFQTDHEFHSIAMPQIGPGKGDGSDGHEDFGRERVTKNGDDRYRFRTPSLRNVTLTGPWGHAGAYNSLRAVVMHHLDPVTALATYDTSQAVLPSRGDLDALDFMVQNDGVRLIEIADRNELGPRSLTENEVDDLMEFLEALTDPASIDLRTDVPRRVPSGLTIVE